jgi:hypothetical protein
MDSKIKRYYSKALLKEAIEATDAKYLEMVRYKTMISIDVGVGGISGMYRLSLILHRHESIPILRVQAVQPEFADGQAERCLEIAHEEGQGA